MMCTESNVLDLSNNLGKCQRSFDGESKELDIELKIEEGSGGEMMDDGGQSENSCSSSRDDEEEAGTADGETNRSSDDSADRKTNENRIRHTGCVIGDAHMHIYI